MPWVTINMMDDHTEEQKKKLFQSVTDAVSNSLELPKEYVRIQLQEMDPKNHSIAGVARSEENK